MKKYIRTKDGTIELNNPSIEREIIAQADTIEELFDEFRELLPIYKGNDIIGYEPEKWVYSPSDKRFYNDLGEWRSVKDFIIGGNTVYGCIWTPKGLIYIAKMNKKGNAYRFVDGTIYVHEVVTKLGKLEDLEEELGCPLEVLFKALNEGFLCEKFVIKQDDYKDYPEKWKQWKKEDNNELQHIGNTKYLKFDMWYKIIYFSKGDTYMEIWLEDYKKTWWLKEDKSE